MTGAERVGDPEKLIIGIASPDQAKSGELAFLEGDSGQKPAISAELDVLIVGEAARDLVPDGASYLVSKLPRYAHGIIAGALFKPRHLERTDTSQIASSAKVHPDAVIGPGAVVGAGAAIGEGAVIGANAVIGPGVQIGRNCVIGPNASVHCALVGDQVILLAGARIGETGFGVIAGPNGLVDAPHYGRVVLQDHVTVGANSCIDRGVFGDTVVGERTKIDNLCQIAHNVVLGRSVIVAAFGGISGSVRVGDGSMLGGRVGIADHVTLGEGVSLAASAGLFRDVAAGETWGGTPAKPIRQWMREIAWLNKQASPKKRD